MHSTNTLQLVGADDGADAAGGIDQKLEEGEDGEKLTALEHLANLEARVKGAVKDQRVSSKNYMKDVGFEYILERERGGESEREIATEILGLTSRIAHT